MALSLFRFKTSKYPKRIIFMLAEFRNFFKRNSANILFFLIIMLLCLLSFGAGMLFQNSNNREPLEILDVQEERN